MSPGNAKSGAAIQGSMPAPWWTHGRTSAGVQAPSALGVETASAPEKPAAERARDIPPRESPSQPGAFGTPGFPSAALYDPSGSPDSEIAPSTPTMPLPHRHTPRGSTAAEDTLARTKTRSP